MTVCNDLRDFIAACRAAGEVCDISQVHWDLELGALVEAAAEQVPDPPLLLFDDFPEYPSGYRVASLLNGSRQRLAIGLDLPDEGSNLELTRRAAEKVKSAKLIPPREVTTGPILEHVMEGAAVDVLTLPVPRYHAGDGGRYLGTGHCVILRARDGSWINMAPYRMQVHEPNVLGLWLTAGSQGRQIAQEYWEHGEACPVVAVGGPDVMMFTAGRMRLPWGRSELDLLGGLRGEPLDVIRGPLTGLPIPAFAELAVEGEIPPPATDGREEGPFGEWPGYYAGGSMGTGQLQPAIRARAFYHRHQPIIVDSAPLWFGAARDKVQIEAGRLWDQLEAAGVPDVVGVARHTGYMWVVAIRQRYAGHARQAGLAVMGCSQASRDGRYVVIVDEDIDPTNLQEVLWAMNTRVDPAEDIEIVHNLPAAALNPRLSPQKRKSGNFTTSRAVFYAVRPWEWRDAFPKTSRSDAALRRQMVERFQHLLPFAGTRRSYASEAVARS